MANKKSNINSTKKTVAKKTNKRTKKQNKIVEKEKNTKNSIIMKILVALGVIILFFVIIYLMNYFFVEKSHIKVNMSTDKKVEYITIANEKSLIATQKYVSDLNYSMRYDIDNFTVFKYKKQDIFKLSSDEKVLVVIEESSLPNSCSASSLELSYNSCFVKVDNYTDEYYLSTNGVTYKVTIKSSNSKEYQSDIKHRINYMLNSFEMIFE